MKIHFVGIKGVGMTPLAVIAKEAGFEVSGSDVADTYITDEILEKAGISPLVGFDATRLKEVDLVITTGAHGGLSNPEVVAAKEKGIKVLMQGQAVGEFMNGELFGKSQTGISVAGCHGKTTTTAMIATVLNEAGLSPSYVIGTGVVPSLGNPGRFGEGKYFIAEADEYATDPKFDFTAKFLWQHPKIAVLTNIEFDHPDLYQDIDAVRKAYEKFAHQIAQDGGLLIVNGDDPQINQLLQTYDGEVITFGQQKQNDYVIEMQRDGNFFLSVEQENWFGEFHIGLPGEHNIKNATAAVIVARELEITKEQIQQGLSQFSGTKRRLEYIGVLSTGAILYDDYAHHPTEIKTTIQALREKYPDKKITVFFQPHTFSRTKLLFEDFIDSFKNVDVVMLSDIYPSAREPFDPTVSSRYLVESLQREKVLAIYVEKPSDMVQYVKQNTEEFDQTSVIVTMGAGDIYQITSDLLKI